MINLPKTLTAFIWYFLKPYKFEITIMILSAFVFAFDLSIRLYFLKVIIDKVVNNPYAESYLKLLLYPVLIYVTMIVISNITYRVWDLICLKVYPEIRTVIITHMVDYTHSHSYEYFQNNLAGNIANKVTNDVTNSVENIIQSSINGMLPNFLAFVIGIITLMFSHIYFGITFLLWAIIYFTIYIKLNKWSQHGANMLAESKSKLSGVIVDSFTNAANVKLFSTKSYELNFIKQYLKGVYQKERNFHILAFYRRCFSSCSTIILSVIILGLLIYTKQYNLITTGDFALVIALSFSILGLLQALSKDFLYFSKEIGTCKQALSIITVPNKVVDINRAKSLKVITGEIHFNSVNFSYTEGNSLFQNQSVIIPGKQKIGLVGYSGSGKSTFVNLIIRLFDIQAGQIFIDKQNIAHVTQKSIRQNIGFIPQDPILFHRTLMENIRYGNIIATDKEVIKAAEKAHAHEFIITTHEGYNSLVGERGIKLSSGQKQRIAIARTILKDAPILIFDEPTSSLDSITENLIQDSLKLLMNNKTVIVIAHRLSTLLNMDRILVFNKGCIVEDGTHKELLAKQGLYTTLWNSQIGGFLPNN